MEENAKTWMDKTKNADAPKSYEAFSSITSEELMRSFNNLKDDIVYNSSLVPKSVKERMEDHSLTKEEYDFWYIEILEKKRLKDAEYQKECQERSLKAISEVLKEFKIKIDDEWYISIVGLKEFVTKLDVFLKELPYHLPYVINDTSMNLEWLSNKEKKHNDAVESIVYCVRKMWGNIELGGTSKMKRRFVEMISNKKDFMGILLHDTILNHKQFTKTDEEVIDILDKVDYKNRLLWKSIAFSDEKKAKNLRDKYENLFFALIILMGNDIISYSATENKRYIVNGGNLKIKENYDFDRSNYNSKNKSD